jgi:phosphinothricin acetyltransferase
MLDSNPQAPIAFYLDAMSADDYTAVALIFEQGIEGGNATYDTRAASWVDWDQKHLVAGRFVARAQQDNRVLGWVALSPISARIVFRGVAELSIYIDNSAHGMGLGDALMAKCIEASEVAGLWTLQSGIFPENQASLRLHEKHGFREVGFREKIGQMRDGRWRDIVFMERRSKIVGN